MAYAPVHGQPTVTFSGPEQEGQHDAGHVPEQAATENYPLAGHYAHKQPATIELQDMDPYWSQPTAYTPGHQRGWSGSTVSFSQPSEQPNPKAPSLESTPTLSKSRSRGSWTLEITTILLAFGAVGAIVGIVARFDGQGLPDWPYYITLNTVIAMLATVAVAAMSTSLQNGLSQLKWIRFKEQRAPLADMEVFDEASRGAWGSLKLLVTARGGYVINLAQRGEKPREMLIGTLLHLDSLALWAPPWPSYPCSLVRSLSRSSPTSRGPMSSTTPVALRSRVRSTLHRRCMEPQRRVCLSLPPPQTPIPCSTACSCHFSGLCSHPTTQVSCIQRAVRREWPARCGTPVRVPDGQLHVACVRNARRLL